MTNLNKVIIQLKQGDIKMIDNTHLIRQAIDSQTTHSNGVSTFDLLDAADAVSKVRAELKIKHKAELDAIEARREAIRVEREGLKPMVKEYEAIVREHNSKIYRVKESAKNASGLLKKYFTAGGSYSNTNVVKDIKAGKITAEEFNTKWKVYVAALKAADTEQPTYTAEQTKAANENDRLVREFNRLAETARAILGM